MTAESRESDGDRDPTRTMELLWGAHRQPSRGPRPALTLERLVRAAFEVAETHGLEGLSMRRVAARLGVGTASLYTYVPGKAELLALVLDAAIGESPLPHTYPGTWREQFEEWARQDWREYRDHPWAFQLASVRPLVGPNMLAWFDSALRVLDGTGLTEREMVAAVESVDGYVRGQARLAGIPGERGAYPRGGDTVWETAQETYLAEHVDMSRYPMMGRVAAAEGFPDSEAVFEFGLQRLLDGIEALISRRARPSGG